MRTLRSALLTLLLLAATLPPVPAIVTDGEPTDGGRLEAAPAVDTIEVAPGSAALVPLTVHNGSTSAVTLDVSAVDVELDDRGRPVHTGRAEAAARWVTVAEDRVRLGAGDTAQLTPAVVVPADATLPALIGLRLTSAGGPALAVTVGVNPPGAAAELTATARLTIDGRRSTTQARIANEGSAIAVLGVRTVVHAWTGREIVDVTTAPVMVGAGSHRDLEVDFTTPGVPGPYQVSVVATDRRGDTVRAAASATVLDPTSTLAAAGVVASALAAGFALRRRRLRLATTSPDGAPADGPHEQVHGDPTD